MNERVSGAGVALALSLVAVTPATPAGAQSRAIEFPDVGGYRTLAVDLHTHSVFSDGSVWPVIRVQESDRDGLALLAVTEHLEHQPRAAGVPNPDRNRSFAVAAEYSGENAPEVIVVNGAEMTVTLANRSDASFDLLSVGPQRFYDHGATIHVPPHGTVELSVTGENPSDFELSFAVLNAIVAPETHPTLRLAVEVPE